jgi:hypothetical protein
MTKTAPMRTFCETKEACARFVETLLDREESDYTLTITIRHFKFGGFSVSAATQPSETTLR